MESHASENNKTNSKEMPISAQDTARSPTQVVQRPLLKVPFWKEVPALATS